MRSDGPSLAGIDRYRIWRECCHDSRCCGVLMVMGEVDRDVWRERLLAVYPSVRCFAAVVASPDVAPDDLVHDAIVSALGGDHLDRVDDVAAYLRRAVLNMAANERRRLGRRRTAVIRLGEASSEAVRDVYPSDLAHLAVLEPRARAVLYLHYVEGSSFEQIADMLGLRPATVRQTASRARRRLRLAEEAGS